jgi:hypothetical protein
MSLANRAVCVASLLLCLDAGQGFAVTKANAQTKISAQTQTVSAGSASPIVPLIAHKAVYDLTLVKSSGARGVEDARGRIAFEFSGDECEGYTLNFRQVTQLSGAETGSRLSDLRTTTFEDPQAKQFRFKSNSLINAKDPTVIDGKAERQNNKIALTLTKPQKQKQDLNAEVLFPTEHLKRVLEAARREQTTFSVSVFDGSDDGKKIYDTLTIIGKKIAAGMVEGLEKAAQSEPMIKSARWPVSISYFEKGEGERTPLYVLSFDLYENGVSRNLKLDYSDFSLKGEMTQLSFLPASSCRK